MTTRYPDSLRKVTQNQQHFLFTDDFAAFPLKDMLERLEKILLFLVILFLSTQLGKHFWAQFSYIYSLKIDYLSPTLYFWDILAAGLLIVWVLQKPHINKMALNIILFFLFTQALSLIKASNVGAGLVRLEQYGIAGFFSVYLASFNFKDWPRRIYLPLALGVMGESIIAILQFIKGSTLGFWILGERSFSISTPGIAKFNFYGQEFLRPYGTFSHPNVLAGFLLLVLVILSITKDLSRMRELKQVLQSNYFLEQRFFTTFRMTPHSAAVLLGGVALFLSMSRTAILAGIISVFLTVKRKWFIWMVLILLVASPILFTRFSSLLNFDNLTVLRREELVGSAWQMFLKFPLFGVGLNNFIPAMANQLVAGPSRFLQPVHNIILLTLAETGIIGLVGFVVLIGYPINRIFNFQFSIFNQFSKFKFLNISNSFQISNFKFQIILPWLIIIFLGMFDHYFLTLPQGYRMLFLIWGLSLSRFQGAFNS